MTIQEDSDVPFLYKICNNSAYEWGISLILSFYKEKHKDWLDVKDIVPS